jgi:hypothetical protein
VNRRSIIRISAITALGLVFSLTGAVAQTKSIKDQLVGTWTLVSWEQTNKDGSKQQDFGPNPKGVTSFDANGRFFVMFARPDLPKISSNDRIKPTPQEAQAISVGSIAYFGTYTVDEPSKTLLLKMESSTYPNQLGTEAKRVITSLTADELKYTNTTPIGGSSAISTAFKRAK